MARNRSSRSGDNDRSSCHRSGSGYGVGGSIGGGKGGVGGVVVGGHGGGVGVLGVGEAVAGDAIVVGTGHDGLGLFSKTNCQNGGENQLEIRE